MARYAVFNGKEMAEFDMNESTQAEVIQSRPLPIVRDVDKAIKEAVEDPIGCRRLSQMVRPGQKVAIIVTDITRKLPEDKILPILLAELLAGGIKTCDITVVVATGTHRPNTDEELVEMFGANMVKSLKFVNHDAWDKDNNVYMGLTRRKIPMVVNKYVAQADIKISTGVIEPHLFAGYSGGVKSVAVGVAGVESIAATHNYSMLSETRLGVVEGNAFRDFLTEAANVVGLDFIVNVIQGANKELVRVVAGHPVKAFLEGVKTARELYEVEVDYEADIVVTGVGYPKNRDLYQATRAANTSVFGPQPVVKKGGVIIIPASCDDGFGYKGYVDWMVRSGGPDDIIEYARTQGFAPGEQKALLLAWMLKHCRVVITDCKIPMEDLRRLHLEAVSSLQEAIAEELRRRPDAQVIVMPDGMLSLPILKTDYLCEKY
ncbi:MAG: nickel-dependent lactate racemase [Bacillota bacterium]